MGQPAVRLPGNAVGLCLLALAPLLLIAVADITVAYRGSREGTKFSCDPQCRKVRAGASDMCDVRL
jgi:hypothetical protein